MIAFAKKHYILAGILALWIVASVAGLIIPLITAVFQSFSGHGFIIGLLFGALICYAVVRYRQRRE